MEQDKEMIDFFVDEIKEIKTDLSVRVDSLVTGSDKKMEGGPFEEFGQMIDRIYGTAATMGFGEIASYCKALKDVCYMASQSENLKGQKKTLRMMIECIGFMETLVEAIYEPTKIKLFNKNIQIEMGKAERLGRAEFASITRKSCA